MITKFKIFESKAAKNLFKVISDPDFKSEDIVNYIGLDKDDYEIQLDKYYNQNFDTDKIRININSKDVEELMNVEEGLLDYILRMSYDTDNYEYYVDDEELKYINSYLSLSGDTYKLIKDLSVIFDYETDPEEEGEIKELFEYLGLEKLLDDIKDEIQMENERAIEKAARYLIKSLPFDIDHNYGKGDFTFTLTFNYDEVLKYLKENKLKEVYTLKDLIENVVNADEFSYDFEELKYDYLGDFHEVGSEIDFKIEKFVTYPDELFPILVENNKLDVIKDKIELADFFSGYDIWIDGRRRDSNLFEIAIHYKNSVLDYFKSYEFQDQQIKKEGALMYKQLDNFDIIDPKIEKEYQYLVDAEKYNM